MPVASAVVATGSSAEVALRGTLSSIVIFLCPDPYDLSDLTRRLEAPIC